LTHKAIIAIIFIAGIIGMGVYSISDVIHKRDQLAEERELLLPPPPDNNGDINEGKGNGTNFHIIIDDGMKGTST